MSRIWTILELLRYSTEHLAKKGLDEPRLEAELLLAGTLGLKRLDLYLQFDRPLAPEELARYRARLLRRARHEPLQYIDGETQFRDLTLRVDRRVLVPRPETELLVGLVLAWAADRPGLTVVDVGTGSGAIALSLASEGRLSRVVATDASPDALELARENAAACGLTAAVELRHGHLLEPLAGEAFDVLVSNPPYVGEREKAGLAPQVRDWEPAAALFGGDDGLDLLRELVAAAPGAIRPGGLLALEIGETQAAAVVGLVERTGAFAAAEVHRDLAGRDRFVTAVRTQDQGP